MITSIKSKKIALKFFSSLILSLAITFLNEALPEKSFSEYKVSASLNENIRLLNLLLPADKRHSLTTILLSEKNQINHKFLSSPKVLKNCSIAIINNEKMINSKISPYSLRFEFVIDKSFNKINCDNAISNKLNEMLDLFFKSLIQDQVKIYESNLYLINESEKDKSKVIDKILDQLKKEDNKNININLLQSNLMDTKSLAGQKNIIETMKKILQVKESFYIYGEKFEAKKTNPYNIFILCFLAIFLILNYSLPLKTLRRILK